MISSHKGSFIQANTQLSPTRKHLRGLQIEEISLKATNEEDLNARLLTLHNK
jgi:hypothetical protein